jgi:hypothetical protein
MAQVGGGIRNDGEEDNDWEFERVREFDGEIEGRIVMSALGALHPVDDALACGLTGAADGDAVLAGGEDGGEVWHSIGYSKGKG